VFCSVVIWSDRDRGMKTLVCGGRGQNWEWVLGDFKDLSPCLG
jgi:hypothetical protein